MKQVSNLFSFNIMLTALLFKQLNYPKGNNGLMQIPEKEMRIFAWITKVFESILIIINIYECVDRRSSSNFGLNLACYLVMI